jgi:hypothetical protein
MLPAAVLRVTWTHANLLSLACASSFWDILQVTSVWGAASLVALAWAIARCSHPSHDSASVTISNFGRWCFKLTQIMESDSDIWKRQESRFQMHEIFKFLVSQYNDLFTSLAWWQNILFGNDHANEICKIQGVPSLAIFKFPTTNRF